MMIRRLVRRLVVRNMVDFEPGDFVRAAGRRGVGLIESINATHATVVWNRDKRDILPLISLRRVTPKGHSLDSKGNADVA